MLGAKPSWPSCSQPLSARARRWQPIRHVESWDRWSFWVYCIKLEIQPNMAKQRRRHPSGLQGHYLCWGSSDLGCTFRDPVQEGKVSAFQCGVSTQILMCCGTCPDPEHRILVWWQLYTGLVRPPWDCHLHPNCWGYEFRGMMVKTEIFPKGHWILVAKWWCQKLKTALVAFCSQCDHLPKWLDGECSSGVSGPSMTFCVFLFWFHHL